MKRLAVRHHSVNRIQGKFTPVPEALHLDITSLVLQAFWRILFMKRDRETGVCTISNRQLASIIGKNERTVQRYTEALQRSSWLCKHVKRIPGKKRNEENTYTFPHLENLSGDKNVVEKNPDLNTNTTAPREVSREEESQSDHGEEIAAESSTSDARNLCAGDDEERAGGICDSDNRSSSLHGRCGGTTRNQEYTGGNQSRGDASGVHVSYHQLKWEYNRALNHPPAMRRLYEENGALQAELRIVRSRHKWRALKASSRATLGTYTGSVIEMTEDDIQAFRRRQDEAEAQRKAQQEREESERKARLLEEAKRYRQEQERMLSHRSRRHHEGSHSESPSGGGQGSVGLA